YQAVRQTYGTQTITAMTSVPTALFKPHPSDSFFYTDTTTSEISTLSLHDALPISATTTPTIPQIIATGSGEARVAPDRATIICGDRKSTRLNSSHVAISYAVFCLKKKTQTLQLLVTADPGCLPASPGRIRSGSRPH